MPVPESYATEYAWLGLGLGLRLGLGLGLGPRPTPPSMQHRARTLDSQAGSQAGRVLLLTRLGLYSGQHALKDQERQGRPVQDASQGAAGGAVLNLTLTLTLTLS